MSNLNQIFSFKTIKGRFVGMAFFFMVIILVFSMIMLYQNEQVNKTITKVLEVRLKLKGEIEEIKYTMEELLSDARNNILKRAPLNADDEGNYEEYKTVMGQINDIDSLKNYLPDSSHFLIKDLKEHNELLNQSFKKADSIWKKNNGYYKELNIRENLTDKAEVTYIQNPTLTNIINSDTIKQLLIEAENAYYSGAFINYSHGNYQGAGYADYVNKNDDFLEVKFISKKPGIHLITYTFALHKGNRPLNIFIDDELHTEKFDFIGTGYWDQWSNTDTLEVYLDSGLHSLKAIATGKSGPNIDYVTIWSPGDGNIHGDSPVIIEAIPDTMMYGELNTKLVFVYRHEVNTMSAVDDVLRANVSQINIALSDLSKVNKQFIEYDNELLNKTLQQTNLINFSLFGLVLLVSILLIYVTIRSLNRSLNHPLQLMKNLAAGDITKKAPNTKDELNQIINAGNVLRDHLQKATEFANSIGEGNLESQYETGSEKDVLGKALLQMRDKLKAIAEEDRKNNWTSKGITQFADLVRKNFDSIEEFSATAISQLVKYIDAKLGMLYIKNDIDEEQIVLDLKGCYAYDRNKYLKNSIEPGYGYAGQVFLEKETIYITDLPEEYVKIGSSLGETQPRSLLLVPVVANDQVEGVLEIASLQEYESYQIKFVEKIAEILGTHIVNVSVNEKTNRLLEESKKQAEEMRAQEEELRQNMEELEAIHEQMRRDQEAEEKDVK
mgnify:CR=1 FL=1